MKSVFKVPNIRNNRDVNNIRKIISNNQGVIACQINTQKCEVSIVYDDYFITEDKIIQCLEDVGYAVF